MNKVNAQQARRILDRIVGYQVSPILWRTVFRGLSAGRVQSVALRLICNREDEIKAFREKEYWSLHAQLSCNDKQFWAKLINVDGKKVDKYELPDAASVRTIMDRVQQRAVFGHRYSAHRKVKKTLCAFYNEHLATGSGAQTELFGHKNHDYCPAAL